ncbi:DUF4023 family protein [Bacillus massiliigorillae]|nr:DUF4023 family protein [Bacillus massiliigorillae]
MENTHEFVEKLKVQKEKQKKNLRSQGEGNPDQKLPNVKHNKRG